MSFLKQLALFFLLLTLITLVVFFYQGRPVSGVDDSNIFMNYARHLAQGGGFVFNSGGERVEGFTSLLWVLICTAFFFITPHPELAMIVFLLLLTSITITLVYREVKNELDVVNAEFSRRYFLPAFVLFLVCIGPFFLSWSVLSLMENGLWNFLFISIIILILRYFRFSRLSAGQVALLVISGVLLVLTRPEALAWSMVFFFLLLYNSWRSGRAYSIPLLFFMLMALAVAGLTAFRVYYFGYPLPNTYYAKVSHDRLYNFGEGLKYLVSFLTNFHPVLSFFLVILVFACIRLIRHHRVLKGMKGSKFPPGMPVLVVSVIILVALLLPLTTGGDHFGGFRFYQGSLLLFSWAFPAFFILKNENAADNKIPGMKPLVFSVGITFLLFTVGALYNLRNIPKTRMIFEFDLATEGRRLAGVLNEFWPQQKPSVGMIAVGGFSLKYQGKTIDLMGLNNILMGHSKGDRIGIKNHAAFNKDVFYQLHSDLVLPKQVTNENEALSYYAQLLSRDHFDNQAMKNIFADEAFRNHYHPVVITGNGKTVFAFAGIHAMNLLTRNGELSLRQIGF